MRLSPSWQLAFDWNAFLFMVGVDIDKKTTLLVYQSYLQTVNVNIEWVLHNCNRESIVNKYDHLLGKYY